MEWVEVVLDHLVDQFYSKDPHQALIKPNQANLAELALKLSDHIRIDLFSHFNLSFPCQDDTAAAHVGPLSPLLRPAGHRPGLLLCLSSFVLTPSSSTFQPVLFLSSLIVLSTYLSVFNMSSFFCPPSSSYPRIFLSSICHPSSVLPHRLILVSFCLQYVALLLSSLLVLS